MKRIVTFTALKVAELAGIAACLWFFHEVAIWTGMLDPESSVGNHALQTFAALAVSCATIMIGACAVCLIGVVLRANWELAGRLAGKKNKEEA